MVTTKIRFERVKKDQIPSLIKFLEALGLEDETHISLLTEERLTNFEVKYKQNPENKNFVLLPLDAAAIAESFWYK